MENAKQITHIVPVGLNAEKIISSIRQYPAHKIILLIHAGDENNEKVTDVINKLKISFHGIEIEEKRVSKEEIFNAAMSILLIIEKEAKNESEVKLNI